MAWIISSALMRAYENSHSSLALAAEYSADTCSDGGLSAQLKSSPIPQAYLSPDKMTAFSRLSRFGMTFEPLMDGHGEALLTWFLAFFHARISALPAKAQESQASDPDCGESSRGLSTRLDPALPSSKTRPPLRLGGWRQCSGTLPRSGTMRSGWCLERTIAERRTDESASGYWPTPTVSGNDNFVGASKNSGTGLQTAVRAWPTPRNNSGPSKDQKHLSLDAAVRIFPTCTARDGRSGKASQATMDRNSRPLSETVGGLLNPRWTEWLMGFPVGWTKFECLATAKFQEWLQQHSIDFGRG